MNLPDDIQIGNDWLALKRVVEGTAVGAIMRIEEFSDLWSMPTSNVLPFAHWLRSLGYEVRNSNTNPQIAERCLLVPYAFPTLTPLSVQLRKSLSGDSNGQDE